MSVRRGIPAAVALALGVAACGSSSSNDLFGASGGNAGTSGAAARGSGGSAGAGSGGTSGSGGIGTGGASGSAAGGAGGNAGVGGAGGNAGVSGAGGNASGGAGGNAGTSGSGSGGAAGSSGAGGAAGGGLGGGAGAGTGGTGGAGGSGGGGGNGNGSVLCGGGTCTLSSGDWCCYGDNVTPYCYNDGAGQSCDCNGILCHSTTVACDGPEDCPSNQVCCAHQGLVSGAFDDLTCQDTCQNGLTDQRAVVCHLGTTCKGGGACKTDSRLPSGYGICP